MLDIVSYVIFFAFLAILLRYIIVGVKFLKDNFQTEPHEQAEPIKIRYIPNDFNKEVVENCKTLLQSYSPTSIWGFNGHAQTFYHIFLRRSPKVSYERVMLDVGNNDKVAIDISSHSEHFVKENTQDTTPTIIIVPGIAGSSKQHYVRNFVSCCDKKGWRTVILNHRGCNQELTSGKMFSIGGTDDLRKAFEYVHEKFPLSDIYAIGFSMGGNVLMNYAGKYHSTPNTTEISSDSKHIPVQSFVSVCQGYSLIDTSLFLPKRPLYDFGLNLKMVGVVKRNMKHFKNNKELDLKTIVRTKSLRDFDDMFTFKLKKVDSSESYYKSECCSQYLPNINTPTFLLNALDDPIVPESQIKYVYDICEQNSNYIMATTKWGGHLGFHEGNPILPNQKTWMDKVSVEYIQTMMDMKMNRSESKSNRMNSY